MGQLQGKATISAGVEPYMNLSLGDVRTLLHFYYSNFDSFMVDIDGLRTLSKGALHHRIEKSEKHRRGSEGEVKEDVNGDEEKDTKGKESQNVDFSLELFRLFDTRKLGRIDMLQLLCAVVVCSCMNMEDKFSRLFDIFDFENRGCLRFDEVVMCFTLSGLGLCNLVPGQAVPNNGKHTTPKPKAMSELAVKPAVIEQLTFDLYRDSGLTLDVSVDFPAFLHYCSKDPLIQSWLYHFENVVIGSVRSREGMIPQVIPTWTYPDSIAWQRRVLRRKAHISSLAALSERERLCKSLLSRQWMEQLKPITSFNSTGLNKQMVDKLELEWVFGYSRPNKGQSNVFYTSSGRMIYPVAQIVVTYDPLKQNQFLFRGHQAPIQILVPFPCFKLFASSEEGVFPTILIWDSETLKVKRRIRGFLRHGITAMTVSDNARFLAALASDVNNTVALYHTKDGELIYSVTSSHPLTAIRFTVNDTFVTCGQRVVSFHRIQELNQTRATKSRRPMGDEGTVALNDSTSRDRWSVWRLESQFRVTKSIGLFDDFNETAGTFTAVGYIKHPNGDQTITGCQNGFLYSWDGRYCKTQQPAHQDGVTVIHSCSRGIATGGNDGKIKLWTCRLHLVATFDMKYNGSLHTGVSSVFWSAKGDRLLVTTMDCQVFELSGITGSNMWPGPVVPSHERCPARALLASSFDVPADVKVIGNGVNGNGVLDTVIAGEAGEVHFAVCPDEETSEVCSVGQDGMLRIWNLDSKRLVAMPLRLRFPGVRVRYAPDSSRIYVGVEVTNGPSDSSSEVNLEAVAAGSPKPRSPIAEAGARLVESAEAIIDKVKQMVARKKNEVNMNKDVVEAKKDEEKLGEEKLPRSKKYSTILTIQRTAIQELDGNSNDEETLSATLESRKMTVALQVMGTSQVLNGNVCDLTVSSNNTTLVVGCSSGVSYVFDRIAILNKPSGVCVPKFLLNESLREHQVSASHVEFHTSNGIPEDRFVHICYESKDGLLSDIAAYDLDKVSKSAHSADGNLKQFQSFEREQLGEFFIDFPCNTTETKLPFNVGMQGLVTLPDAVLSRRIRSIDVFGSGPSGVPLVVSADNLGTVRLQQYPCLSSTDKFQVNTGHGRDTAHVCFSSHGDRVISCGGDDGCIFLWKLKLRQTCSDSVSSTHTSADNPDMNFRQAMLASLDQKFKPGNRMSAYLANGIHFPRYTLPLVPNENIEMGFLMKMDFDESRKLKLSKEQLDEPNQGFLVNKPCIRQATTPRDFHLPSGQSPEPNCDLDEYAPFNRPRLLWINGYTSRFGTNTAQYIRVHRLPPVPKFFSRQLTSQGMLVPDRPDVHWGSSLLEATKKQEAMELDIAFTAGRMVVLQTRETPEQEAGAAKQRFFDQHITEVTTLCVSYNREIIASAHVGPAAPVMIWSSTSLGLLGVIEGCFSSAITMMNFSTCGALLAVSGFDTPTQNVGDGPQFIAVYRWQTGELIGRTGTNVPHGLRYERKDLMYEKSRTNYDSRKAGRSTMVEVNGKFVERSQLFSITLVPTSESYSDENPVEVVGCGVGGVEWSVFEPVTKEFETSLLQQQNETLNTCCAWIKADSSDSECVVGNDQGILTQYSKSGKVKEVKAHKGPITCARSLLVPSKVDGQFEFRALVTAGVEGQVAIWNKILTRLSVLDIYNSSTIRIASSVIRSLDVIEWSSSSPEDGVEVIPSLHVLVGTNGSQIMEFEIVPEAPAEENSEEQTMETAVDEEDSSNKVPQPLEPLLLTTGHIPQSLHSDFVTGNPRNKVVAMAIHPTKPIVCTGSDLGVVMFLDTKTMQITRTLVPKVVKGIKEYCGQVRALAYSTNGRQLAVGFGKAIDKSGTKYSDKQHEVDVEDDVSGTVLVYDTKSFSIMGTVEVPKGTVNDIKYSKNGAFLSLASQDGAVYTFNAEAGFTLVSTFSNHSSPPSHLDFADDSEIVRSSSCHAFENGAGSNENTNMYEIRLSDAISGNEIPTPDAVRDKTWTTENIPVEWNYQGAWHTRDNLVTSGDTSPDNRWVVTGNLFGGLELAVMPRRTTDDKFQKLNFHIGPVGQVRFSVGHPGRFVSCGACDGLIGVFDCPRHPESAVSSSESRDSRQVRAEVERALEGQMQRIKTVDTNRSFLAFPGIPNFRWTSELEERLRGKRIGDSGSVLQVVPEFVHGYSGEVAMNNLHFLSDGEIAYSAGAVCVLYDPSQHSQEFLLGHSTHVTRLVQCPQSPDLLFSCEVGGAEGPSSQLNEKGGWERLNPDSWWGQVKVWHTPTRSELSNFPAHHKAAVVHLAVSSCGTYVVTVDNEQPCNTLALWVDATSEEKMWKSPIVVSTGKLPKASRCIFAIAISQPAEYMVMTSTTSGLYFWSRGSGSSLILEPTLVSASDGNQDGCSPGCNIHTAGISTGPNGAITGTAIGNICTWEGVSRTNVTRAHSGAVSCLKVCHPQMFPKPVLVSGGADGFVQIWDLESLTLLQSFDLTKVKPEPQIKDVRSATLDHLGVKVLVGMAGGEVIQLVYSTAQAKLLLSSCHAQGELWGLDVHPSNASWFTTGGDDASLVLWDAKTRVPVQSGCLDAPARSVRFSGKGEEILVGYGAHGTKEEGGESNLDQSRLGNFVVVNVESFELLHEGKSSLKDICEVKFSPDSKMVAIAAADGYVYIHSVSDGFAMRSKCKVNPKGRKQLKTKPVVEHVEYSANGKILRTQSRDAEGNTDLCYFNLPRGNPLTAEPSDVTWSNPSCTIQQPGVDVICETTTSSGVRLVAHGNGNMITVTAEQQDGSSVSTDLVVVHGQTVKNLAFACDGSRLFSVGGVERVIVQWKIDLE